MKPRDLRNGALAAAVVLVLSAETLLACPYTTCLDCSSGSVPGVGLGNGAQGCASPTSSHPVRYFDGLLLYKTPAIGFPSADGSWSFSLTYNNRPEDAVAWIDEHFGYNWYSSIPRLEFRSASLIKMIADGHTAADFSDSTTPYGGPFVGQHGVWAEIRIENGYYKLRGTNGGEAWFFQTGGNKGKLYKTVSPYGKEWVFSYQGGSDGKGGTLLNSITEPGGYGWFFYYGTGYRVGYISVWKGGSVIANIYFSYYTSTTSDGVAGDLKRITIDEDAGDGTSPVREITFRYWVGDYDPDNEVFGQTHDLKLVIGAMASKVAMRAEGQGSLDNIATSTLYEDKHFDLYARYYDDHRVALEEVQTGQCSCGGGGQVGQYTYEYYPEPNEDATDYTTPKYGIEQGNPDGSRYFVELNSVGSAVTTVHQEPESAGSRRWAEVRTYDDYGQIVQVLHPSACDASEYDYPSWVDGNGDVEALDTGHADAYEYYSGSQFSSDRTLWGKIKARYVQQGTDTGTRKKLEEFVYLDSGSGCPGRHLWKHRIYRTANTYNETVYSYTYYGGDYDRVASRTTTHPTVTVPASQGAASRSEIFSSTSGVLEMVTHEDGFIDVYNHSGATGLLANKTSDYTGDGALQLFETWDYDKWGRRIRHTTYDGSSAQAPKLKVERWLYTHMAADAGDETYYQRFVAIAYEHVVENAQNLVDQNGRDGLARIVVRDLDGNVVEEADGYRATTGQALSSDFDKTDASLHVAFEGTEYRRKTYVYLGGVLRKEHAWVNAQGGSQRYTTEYEYDVMGRRTKLIAPDAFPDDHDGYAEGGVTEWEYDARGNLVKTYVYTTTRGAPIEERYYDYNEPGSVVNAGDDLLTRVDRLVGADAQNPVRRITKYDYDWEDHLIATASKAKAAEPYWRVTENTYDYSGRVVTESTYFGVRNSGVWELYYDATMSGAKELWKEEVTRLYDERSRVYQESRTWSEIVDGPPEAGQTYVTKTWHDKRNRTLKDTTPRGSFTKYEYDRVGRTVGVYFGYDLDEGLSFAEADDNSVNSGDVVLSQSEVQYDRAGRGIKRTRYDRKPEEQIASSQTGPLDASNARRSFTAWWYSGAGRMTASVDWGDYGGDVPTRNSTPPARSDDDLRTDYEYGYGASEDTLYSGQEVGTTWVIVTDPAEKAHYSFQDNLGRDLRTIRNYYSGGEPGYYDDAVRGITVQRNITTSFQHDGSGHLVRAVAHDCDCSSPGTGNVTKQVTAYEYGVGTSDSPGASEVASLDLVRRICYGQDSGSESFSEQVVLGYNRQGQVIWRGESAYWIPASATYRAPHSYSYDLLGQLEEDAVGSTMGDVDTSIKALAYQYDSHGRLVVAKSLDASDTVVNTVTRKYNEDGFLAESAQDHGATWSKTVTYGYGAGPGTAKDLTSVTYPSIGGSSRVVSYSRNDTGDEWDKADWMSGRVSKIEGSLSGNTDRVQYTYMGSATPMRTTYGASASPVAKLELLGGSTSLSLDRFGRPNRLKAKIVEIVDDEEVESQVFEYAYTYDRLHSLKAKDGDGTFPQPFHNEAFEYDDIGRLGKFDPEGASNDTKWKLTGIGNWDTVYFNGSSVDHRTHDAQNEITTRTVPNQQSVHPHEDPPDYVPYDVAGNLIIAPTDAPDALSDRMLLVYDAWNRLVRVMDDDESTIEAQYERDALGRIIREAQTGEHYFYSADWQTLSVLNDASGQNTRIREYVWGTRYIDELAMSYSNGMRRYHLQDTNWNVVATLDHQVARLEAIRYDPYGQPYFYDVSGGQYALPPSNWESPEGTDVAFQGRWYQKFETDEGRLRLYDFRNRTYAPILGRFLQRDPMAAGALASELQGVGEQELPGVGEQVQFAGGAPTAAVDPCGLTEFDFRDAFRQEKRVINRELGDVYGEMTQEQLDDIGMTRADLAAFKAGRNPEGMIWSHEPDLETWPWDKMDKKERKAALRQCKLIPEAEHKIHHYGKEGQLTMPRRAPFRKPVRAFLRWGGPAAIALAATDLAKAAYDQRCMEMLKMPCKKMCCKKNVADPCSDAFIEHGGPFALGGGGGFFAFRSKIEGQCRANSECTACNITWSGTTAPPKCKD